MFILIMLNLFKNNEIDMHLGSAHKHEFYRVLGKNNTCYLKKIITKNFVL